MQIETIRNIAVATTGTVIVAAAIRSVIETRAERAAEEQLIQENANLDIIALNNAARHVRDRIVRGEIHSLDQLTDAFNVETRFQKIAVRED